MIKILLTAVLLCGAAWQIYSLCFSADSRECPALEMIHSGLPGEETPENRNIGQALPGTFIFFNSSRRNNDLLRRFRTRTSDFLLLNRWDCAVTTIPEYCAELPYITFAFQNFLQNSLPPRAGPAVI